MPADPTPAPPPEWAYLESCERMLRRILELQRDPRIDTSPLGPTLRNLGLSEMPLREPIEIRFTMSGGPYPVVPRKRHHGTPHHEDS